MSALSNPAFGLDMFCTRCENILRRVKKDPLRKGLAWSLTALLFYILTIFAPLMQVTILGEARSGSIVTGPMVLSGQGFWVLASVVLFTTVVMPLIKIFGTIIVLIRALRGTMSRPVARLYALLRHVGPWVMIEVYLLGLVVAYSRLQVITHIHLAVAIVGLVGLMLALIAMEAVIDQEAVWETIEKRQNVAIFSQKRSLVGCDTCSQVSALRHGQLCPRCGEVLHRRKPNSMARGWAFTLAAAVLYIPSNMYPIMHVRQLAKQKSYTIYGGLEELAKVGLWPLAVLVFCASIAIPVFKLAAMTFMLRETHLGSTTHLRNRTRLYRIVNFIGRWSMVDVFVVSLLVAMVRFGWLTEITPDWGAVYFAAVVVLTMLAVESFDSRLMWDAAAQSSHPSQLPAPSYEGL